jgi:hypothetical protein
MALEAAKNGTTVSQLASEKWGASNANQRMEGDADDGGGELV